MAQQLLLLLPEDVLDGPPAHLLGPEYAEIVDDSVAERVGVRVLLANPPDDEEAEQAAEVSEWASRSRVNLCRVDATVVVEVAPAVVFLLLGATLLRRLKTRRAIDQAHSRILDRLLGTQGATTTRDIRHLLAGIAPLAEHPRPTITLTWMTHGPDKMSVAVSVTSFISVFYKDGNRVAPTDLRLGNHFWEDPSMDSPRVKPLPTQPRALQTDPLPATNSPPTESHTAPQAADYGGTAEVEDTTPSDRSRFVDFMDALEETNAVQNSVGHSMTGPPLPDATRTDGAPRGTRRRDESTAGTADASMRILAALSEHPDLLQHYARQMSVAGQETKRPRYSSISDILSGDETPARPDRQHSYRPSTRQQDVHTLMCADDR
ncbi:hypothetical protein PC119_g13996 [Phytophthora cactorum]|uniref:Uncharacterized protein n=2 Tax=Phytophthora cactorum TaxID=29920 RepID=A0A8T1CWQ0_9STRA|nr:hypothetical protein PC111_g12327 [Phytophthora cactorum]KAG2821318.1 hypothetical protein PC112_g11424 [Phytophthora cactorum]KAG2929185.1 hypothetical protein PC117_g14063 [Phytophthora cactorum]KAG3009158.1 hypothetical protein PC119_g13996 [Phytophthora cactorum]